MGHFIQAIVAPIATAQRVHHQWPELPSVTYDGKHILFPVNAELIDQKFAPDRSLAADDESFTLLTQGLCNFLSDASRGGELAYLETEYFGGQGGQGAMVLRDGVMCMPPEWAESETINRALRKLGVLRTPVQDEFVVVGLGLARNNCDLIDALKAWP